VVEVLVPVLPTGAPGVCLLLVVPWLVLSL